jgi:hypothetical protein
MLRFPHAPQVVYSFTAQSRTRSNSPVMVEIFQGLPESDGGGSETPCLIPAEPAIGESADTTSCSAGSKLAIIFMITRGSAGCGLKRANVAFKR